jgi:hypothetical protein
LDHVSSSKEIRLTTTLLHVLTRTLNVKLGKSP